MAPRMHQNMQLETQKLKKNSPSPDSSLNDLRGLVLYALRSFPTDISEDFCDDFIDS